jgi:hypothetical protein
LSSESSLKHSESSSIRRARRRAVILEVSVGWECQKRERQLTKAARSSLITYPGGRLAPWFFDLRRPLQESDSTQLTSIEWLLITMLYQIVWLGG